MWYCNVHQRTCLSCSGETYAEVMIDHWYMVLSQQDIKLHKICSLEHFSRHYINDGYQIHGYFVRILSLCFFALFLLTCLVSRLLACCL